VGTKAPFQPKIPLDWRTFINYINKRQSQWSIPDDHWTDDRTAVVHPVAGGSHCLGTAGRFKQTR